MHFILAFVIKPSGLFFTTFIEATDFNEKYWKTYKKVNYYYADQLAEILEDGDFIWVHDYHLMLLPKLLRDYGKKVNISFFLHIPFPTFEIFRLFPRNWAEEILKGILGADLTGFHTHDYTQYFLRCINRILGIEHTFGNIYLESRIVRVDAFPIGIDYNNIIKLVNSKEVKIRVKQVRDSLQNRKVILSVDRLDYTKGIINRLQAFEKFLEQHPEWHEKVVLYCVVVPSRVGVEHYQTMKRRIDEQIGKVNGKFSRPNWVPIIYQYRYLEPSELFATYVASDIALVTPIRDGMNLIAKEYAASKTDHTGVLILSETAGAAQELGEAVMVNPNNIEEISEAIFFALEMPKDEQIKRMSQMRRRVERYNVLRWGDDIVKSTLELKEIQRKLDTFYLPRLKDRLISEFKEASNRLILVDYDGTLMPFFKQPNEGYQTLRSKTYSKH